MNEQTNKGEGNGENDGGENGEQSRQLRRVRRQRGRIRSYNLTNDDSKLCFFHLIVQYALLYILSLLYFDFINIIHDFLLGWHLCHLRFLRSAPVSKGETSSSKTNFSFRNTRVITKVC